MTSADGSTSPPNPDIWLRRARLVFILAMLGLMFLPFTGTLVASYGDPGSYGGPTYHAGEFDSLITGWAEFQYWLVPPVLFFGAWLAGRGAPSAFKRAAAGTFSVIGVGLIWFFGFALSKSTSDANVMCTAGKIYLALGVLVFVLTLIGAGMRRSAIAKPPAH